MKIKIIGYDIRKFGKGLPLYHEKKTFYEVYKNRGKKCLSIDEEVSEPIFSTDFLLLTDPPDRYLFETFYLHSDPNKMISNFHSLGFKNPPCVPIAFGVVVDSSFCVEFLERFDIPLLVDVNDKKLLGYDVADSDFISVVHHFLVDDEHPLLEKRINLNRVGLFDAFKDAKSIAILAEKCFYSHSPFFVFPIFKLAWGVPPKKPTQSPKPKSKPEK